MKLYEFKAKYMSRIALLRPTNNREKQLKDTLMNKLNNLRAMNLPNLVHSLYMIIEYENVSSNFKKICREMIEDVQKLEGTE